MAGNRSNLIFLFEEFLDVMNQVARSQQQLSSYVYHFQRNLFADLQRFIDLVGGVGPGNMTVEKLIQFIRTSEFVDVHPTGNLIVQLKGFGLPNLSENGDSEDEKEGEQQKKEDEGEEEVGGNDTTDNQPLVLTGSCLAHLRQPSRPPTKQVDNRITKPLRKKDFVLGRGSQKESKEKYDMFDERGKNNKINTIKDNQKNKRPVIKKRVKSAGSSVITAGGVERSKTRNRTNVRSNMKIKRASRPLMESDTSSVDVLLQNKSKQRPAAKAKLRSKQGNVQEKVVYVKCPKCDEVFLQSEDMMRHVKEVHRKLDKPYYSCPVGGCKSLFKHRGFLDDHMIWHLTNNVPLYPCEFCSDIFLTHQRLNHHINMNHHHRRGLK